MIPYDSPKGLSAFLKERGFALRKRFGQNFLVNPRVRERILSVLEPSASDLIWEIGPGLGCMTGALLNSGARVRAFEIDRGFLGVLEEEFRGRENFHLTGGDVLDTWRALRGENPSKVFGNLPYSAASAIIADFIEEDFLPDRWVFMVQREVAARMAARPGTKNYSSFSLLCQTFMNVKVRFDVGAGSFYPPPEVISSVVELRPRQDPPEIADRRVYLGILRALFASRRKTLRNNLVAYAAARGNDALWAADLLEKAGLRPEARGETLSPAEVARLANAAGTKKDRPDSPDGP